MSEKAVTYEGSETLTPDEVHSQAVVRDIMTDLANTEHHVKFLRERLDEARTHCKHSRIERTDVASGSWTFSTGVCVVCGETVFHYMIQNIYF